MFFDYAGLDTAFPQRLASQPDEIWTHPRPAPPAIRGGGSGPPPPPYPASRRDPLVAAMLWLGRHFMEGLAAYAESMYPGLAAPCDAARLDQPAEPMHVQRTSPSALAGGSAAGSTRLPLRLELVGLPAVEPEAAVSQELPGRTARPLGVPIGSRLRSILRAATTAASRRTTAARELAALDDRMLRDIGIARDQIELFVRRDDPFR
jgi:uncharacterized protein YjiS (DUF1127 family)